MNKMFRGHHAFVVTYMSFRMMNMGEAAQSCKRQTEQHATVHTSRYRAGPSEVIGQHKAEHRHHDTPKLEDHRQLFGVEIFIDVIEHHEYERRPLNGPTKQHPSAIAHGRCRLRKGPLTGSRGRRRDSHRAPPRARGRESDTSRVRSGAYFTATFNFAIAALPTLAYSGGVISRSLEASR